MSDINVTVAGVTGVTATVGANGTVNVSAGSTAGAVSVTNGPGFGVAGATSLMVEAGANITVTTSQGSFTVSGRDVPVQSVNGRTGAVVLTAADVGGLTSVANVTKVNGRTGAVTLVSTDVSAASASHSHVAASITDLTNVANVVSVNGRTGSVSLVSTDVSAASASHSHVAANISNLTAVANVVSVNGVTGTPTIVAGSNVTVTTAGSSITISAASGGGSSVSLSSATPQPLGTASAGSGTAASRADHVHALPTAAAIGAAAASHTHTASQISDFTSVANVISVNGMTGAVSVVAGLNVTVTTSTVGIVVTAPAATQGPPGSFGDPQTISAKTASYSLQLADVGTLLTFSGDATVSMTVTVPNSSSVAWVAGSHIDVARVGAASVQVSGAAGVTVLATPGPSLRATGSGGSLVCLGSNNWLLVGDLI